MLTECPHCQKQLPEMPLGTDENGACPFCSKTLFLTPPPLPDSVPPINPGFVFCRKCGHQHLNTANYCSRCGTVLNSNPAIRYEPKSASGVDAVIPISNPLSLWAYYMGIFAIIPLIGIPLGIASVICGFKGLAVSRTLPRRAGRLHSLAGIILGLFFIILYPAIGILFYFLLKSQ